jgi:hypothetical protein
MPTAPQYRVFVRSGTIYTFLFHQPTLHSLRDAMNAASNLKVNRPELFKNGATPVVREDNPEGMEPGSFRLHEIE